jgi:hypothetical protein
MGLGAIIQKRLAYDAVTVGSCRIIFAKHLAHSGDIIPDSREISFAIAARQAFNGK